MTVTRPRPIKNPARNVTTTEIPLDHLYVPDYQRQRINWKLVNKITANYDPYKDQPLEITPRHEGGFWIVDGQHRWLAKSELRHRTATCRVVARKSHAEQATYFIDLNTERKKITPVDKFRAGLHANDDECNSIASVVIDVGAKISGCDMDGSGPTIAAVESLRAVHRLGGDRLLTDTLDILLNAWPNSKEAMKAYYINGVAQFLSRYGERADMARVKMVLARLDPMSLKTKAGQLGDFAGPAGRQSGMVRAIAVAYNERLRSEKRLELI